MAICPTGRNPLAQRAVIWLALAAPAAELGENRRHDRRPVGPAAPPIIDPADALAELVAGNKRFVSGRPEHGHQVSAAAAASGGQQPHAVVLGCIDSRVPLEAIFDQTFGSICVVRSGGARGRPGGARLGRASRSAKLGVPLIMVLGHKRCGAVQATVDALRSGELPGRRHRLPGRRDRAGGRRRSAWTTRTRPSQAMRAHVAATVRPDARDRRACREAVAAGRVDVVGAVYDLDTGWVDFLEQRA